MSLLPFNPQQICDAIIREGSADSVIDQDPSTILPAISRYREQEFIALFPHRFSISPTNKDIIESALRVLYSESLRNSNYNSITQTLDSEMSRYLSLSNIFYMQFLKEKGIDLLYQSQQPDALLQCATRITDVLNLYFYLEPDQRVRIEKIAAEALHFNGIPIYPFCRNYFWLLCTNLEQNQEEKRELTAIRTALLRKTMFVREQSKALYRNTESTVLPKEREVFFQRHTNVLWDAGAAFIEDAFWAMFEDKRKYHTYLPGPFVTAILNSTRIHKDWHHLTFDYLRTTTRESLPPGFVYQVWSEYLDKRIQMSDLGDFVRFLLRSLSPKAFEKLEADLKNSADPKKTLIDAFSHRANRLPGVPITFMSLKRWIESA